MMRGGTSSDTMALLGAILVVGVVTCLSAVDAISIEKFGAKPFVSSENVAAINSEALQKAFYWANASSSDRTVEIPVHKNFVVFNTTVRDLNDVSLEINGNLTMAANISWWPYKNQRPNWFSMLAILSSSSIRLRGNGTVDGQGYNWWWAKFLVDPVQRPYMFTLVNCSDVVIEGFTALNSPKYHFKLDHLLRLYVNRITILVDVFKQKEMMQKHGYWQQSENAIGGLPIFPLNTDGFDPRGKDMLIENIFVQNFDDVVAVKPSSKGNAFTSCSQNITVRDSRARFGVGMTIGSVPPDTGTNCVRDIKFENIVFDTPIKAVYIKTNPGTVGDGLIDNISYRNVKATNSLWYPIWIGPQQQEQPGSSGTGCSFLYPIVNQCPTQPRVPITNIFLKDMNFTGGLTLPGVLLCNSTNPCRNFQFDNVHNRGEFLVQKDYVCKNIIGSNSSGSFPTPNCF